jgi:hypothetical protein
MFSFIKIFHGHKWIKYDRKYDHTDFHLNLEFDFDSSICVITLYYYRLRSNYKEDYYLDYISH